LPTAEGAGISIEPWDYRYYAEKVRKAKYDVDHSEITPYLQLESLREAMFWVAASSRACAFRLRRQFRYAIRMCAYGT
jgi:Zn-dependent oligopeptidase